MPRADRPRIGEIEEHLKASGMLEDPADGVFFPFHAVHDLDHARTTREAMIKAASTDAELRECLRFAIRAALLVFDLFDDAFAAENLAIGTGSGLSSR